MKNIKEISLKVREKLNKFFDSDWFIVVFASLMMFSWIIKNEMVAAIFLALSLCLVFVSSTHLNALIPIFCMFQTFIYVGLGDSLAGYHFIIIGILTVFILASIIFYFISNKKNKTNYDKFRLGKLFWGLIAVLLAVALGGLGYEKLAFYWVLISAGFVGLIVGIYLLLLNRTKDDGFKITACRCLMALGVVVLLQVCIVAKTSGDAMNMFLTKTVNIGWATSNAVAIIMAFIIPPTAYLGLKSKHPSLYIILCLVFGCLGILMQSRGVSLLLFAEIPIILVLMVIFCKNRFEVLMSLLVLFAGASCVISLSDVDLTVLYSSLSNIGFSDNGRFDDWRYFYSLYEENKDFGIGFFGYSGSAHVGPLNKVHSTILQIWFCTGIVGSVLFVVHYIQRYLLFIVKLNIFKFFMLITMVVFELYGLIDMTLLMYYLMMALFVIFVAIEKEPNNKNLKTNKTVR